MYHTNHQSLIPFAILSKLSIVLLYIQLTGVLCKTIKTLSVITSDREGVKLKQENKIAMRGVWRKELSLCRITQSNGTDFYWNHNPIIPTSDICLHFTRNMSFVSKNVKGDYDNKRRTDPELESSMHKERAGTEVLGFHRSRGFFSNESNIHRLQQGQMKSQQTPGYRSKLMEYLQGETDILCFTPTAEDCTSTAFLTAMDGLVPTPGEDDEDDLIYVDNGHKNGSKKKSSQSSPANVIMGFSNANVTPKPSSSSDIVKDDYDYRNVTADLLWSNESNSLVASNESSSNNSNLMKVQTVAGSNLNFESAGFSTEDALIIKRRIKLQKLVRGLNAGLSNNL